MPMTVYVYRDNLGDCTNNGVSSKVDQLTVMNVEGPFEPTEDRPAVILIQGPGGQPNPCIVPAVQDEETGAWKEAEGWHMFGGNFAASSDSRWMEAGRVFTRGVSMPAIKIHDRVE